MLRDSDKNFFFRMMVIHKSETCNAYESFALMRERRYSFNGIR